MAPRYPTENIRTTVGKERTEEVETPVTTALAQHIANAGSRPLPPVVADCAKQHVLDRLIAMLSGATLLKDVEALLWIGPPSPVVALQAELAEASSELILWVTPTRRAPSSRRSSTAGKRQQLSD